MITQTETESSPITLATIEAQALRLCLERTKLQGLVQELQARTEALLKQGLPEIRKVLARASEREQELRSLVESARPLFDKPRTHIFHGIKVGLEKGKGKIEMDDEQRTIKLIRDKLLQKEDDLIKWEEWVSKTALRDLTVSELKSIGCTVEEAGDHVVVRPVDGNVEKTVKSLLSSSPEK